jgi:hypothetical protein
MREGNQIEWGACLRAPAEFGRHERARVLVGDIILAVKGATIAAEKSVCLIDELSEPTIVNGSIFRFQPKHSEVSGEFLLEILSSSIARRQMKGAMILNNAVDYLSRDVIDQLLLPISSPTEQTKLVRVMAAARAARRRKLEEAESLLGGLDAFVLEALGLTLPPPDGHRTTYAVRLSDVREGKKLYPDYFHPERLNAIRAVERKYKGDRCATLLSVAEFRRDHRQIQPDDPYLGLANVQPNTGVRIDSTEDDGEGTVFDYAENDVLFARLRPYLNKVYRAESGGVCSPEFHVMRVRPGEDGKPRVIPDYLAAVLRSGLVLSQTRHMMTGNTHPRLANDDVVNLVVPVPDSATQKKIAAEVSRRRGAARRLRDEASRLWDDAKRRFEEELLGPEPLPGRPKP